MPRYLTGLITTDYWRYPPFPYTTRHWRLHLCTTDRSRMHAELSDGGDRRTRRRSGKEVVLEARDRAAARRVAFLLQAAAQVWDGSAFLARLGSRIELLEVRGTIRDRGVRKIEERATRSNSDIPLECMLAVKAAQRRNRVYALTKLWLSYQVFSVDSIDLDPSHSATIPKFRDAADHVSSATAIVLAYSAIEELGLEVRASQERPSTLNGVWNPVVKDDLEKRLQAAGVDSSELYDWQIRGPKTKLESERPARKVRPSPWSRWDVRDVEVEVVDAIAHASWLRSRVSAHKLRYEYARALSVYDVANAQYLARRLLLEISGLWRT